MPVLKECRTTQTLIQARLQHFQAPLSQRCKASPPSRIMPQERELPHLNTYNFRVLLMSWSTETNWKHRSISVCIFCFFFFCFFQLLWTAYVSKCKSNIFKLLQLTSTLNYYLKLQPAPFYNTAIVLTVVLVKTSSTYLLFCTSVSNKCLEMKMYSTPSLSWLLLARVVSAVSLKEKKKQKQKRKERMHKTI